MFGGPPNFLPPAYVQPYAPTYPAPPAPAYRPPAPARTTAPAFAPPRVSAAPLPRPAPTYRAQDDDEPRLQMPSPEQLGVVAAAPVAVDWASVHQRLDRVGATCFHLEKLERGACRVTCLLPCAEANRTHRIESQAGSEAEAVRIAVTQAEEWANASRR